MLKIMYIKVKTKYLTNYISLMIFMKNNLRKSTNPGFSYAVRKSHVLIKVLS